jgi:endonuclease-3
MASIPKTKKIETLQKALHRRFKWQSELPERTVLEHLVYSALLEDSPAETASTAYEILESYFIDWNEVRVTTTQELAEIITVLPDPLAAAERVRKSLRGVFEKTYMFDLEELRKKGKSLSQAIAFLKSLGTLSRFMADYVTQFALGGHVIPLDESTMRIFRMLELTQVNKERTEEFVPGIERAVPKKNGIVFTMELHNFAYSLRTALDTNQNAAEFLSVLKNIDPQSPTRDYTPPALTIPKPQPKEKPNLPPQVTIPFGVADDDDFDDDHDNHHAEVEFLPDELNLNQKNSPEYFNPTPKNNTNINSKPKPKKESNQDKNQNKKISPNLNTPTLTPTLTPNPPTTATAANSITTNSTNSTTTNSTITNSTTQKISTPKNDNVKTQNKNPESQKITESANKIIAKKNDNQTKISPTSKNNNDNINKNIKPEKKAADPNVHSKQPSLPTQPNSKNVAAKIIVTKNPKSEPKKNITSKEQKSESKKNIKPDKNDKNKLENANKKNSRQPEKKLKDKKQTINKPKEQTKKIDDKKIKNNKKIINVVSKESKSVTKQLQKKRPK